MKTNIVRKLNFGDGGTFLRLDAEFVDPELLARETALAERPSVRLRQIVEPVTTYYQRESEGSIRYISIDSIDNEDGLVFEEEWDTAELPSRAKYLVMDRDILVSNVRPNRGAVAFLAKRHNGYVASSGFTLVRTNETDELSSDYIFAFLKSDFGRDQLVRRNRGSMYPAVVSSDVFDIVVPKPKREVSKAVSEKIGVGRKAQEDFRILNDEMNGMADQFLVPYGLPPDPLIGFDRRLDWMEIGSSRFFAASGPKRFDAEFYRNGYDSFDETCRKGGPSFLLGEHFDLFPGRALPVGDEELFYAKQAVLTNVGVNWSAVEEVQGEWPASYPRILPGDILLACTAHEIPYVGRKVDLVRDLPDGADEVGLVPDLMVLRPKVTKPTELSSAFVAAFLRHPAGRFQVQRCIRGLRGGHVYRDDLAQFVRVPVPPKDWVAKFDALAGRAEMARNVAKARIREAILIVNRFCASGT